VWVSRSFGHALIIQGCFVADDNNFLITSVYAPCDLDDKQYLWLQLCGMIDNNKEANWCVSGDFSAIHSTDESRSRVVGPRQDDFF
jgi:hypothetical protein